MEASHLTAVEASKNLLSSPVGSVEKSGASFVTPSEDSNLQDVIRFLRRSQETSEMELLMLRQERARLHRQVCVIAFVGPYLVLMAPHYGLYFSWNQL